MRYSRGPSGAGPILLLMVAVVAIPELLKKCKPVARSLGDMLVEAGKQVHRMGEVEEPTPPPPVRTPTAEAPPKPAAQTVAKAEPDAADKPSPKAPRSSAPKPKAGSVETPEPKSPKKRRKASPPTPAA